jgi:hypothetical protein
MAMNMNLLLQQEIKVLRGEDKRKSKRGQGGVLILVMIWFYLYRKVRIEFNSLIRSFIGRLMSLHLGQTSELHDAAVAARLLDIL